MDFAYADTIHSDQLLMIPVSVITGFLGSGKTTLIARLVRQPEFRRTAVIVNEWGEIGLDHDLIASADETLVTLATGCLCCRVRGDLSATLLDLYYRTVSAEVPAYESVLIETSGMADPVPILHSLIANPDIGKTHRLDTVLTLVDARHGPATLEEYVEAHRQVAVADRLLLTKRDLEPDVGLLYARIAELNPDAPVLSAIKGDIAPELLFAGKSSSFDHRWASTSSAITFVPAFRQSRHTDHIDSFTLQRERPIPGLALALWLQALSEHCGARLLRLKGLIEVEEMPGRPAVIHVVQHTVSSPEWLETWPSPDHSSRIVVIGQGIPRYFPARLLEAIEAEVRDEMQYQIALRP